MQLLEEAALLAKRKDCQSLLQNRDEKSTLKENDNRIFFITTFYPNNTSVQDIVLKNWEIQDSSSTTTHIHQKKLMVGFRRPKNLSDILVKAAIPQVEGDEQLNPIHIQLLTAELASTIVAHPVHPV